MFLVFKLNKNCCLFSGSSLLFFKHSVSPWPTAWSSRSTTGGGETRGFFIDLLSEYQVEVAHYLNLDIQIITWFANFAFVVLLIPKAFAKVLIMARWINGILLRIALAGFCESKGRNFHLLRGSHSLLQKEYLPLGYGRIGLHTQCMGGYSAQFFASGSQHFFPAFCELQTLIKRESRQDIFHWLSFGEIKY